MIEVDHDAKKRKLAASSPSAVIKKKVEIERKLTAAPSVHAAATAAREPLMLSFPSRGQAFASLAPNSLEQEAGFTAETKKPKKKKTEKSK